MTAIEDPHLIRRHGGWFRPNAQGYTTSLADAGIYPGKTARRYLDVEGLTIHPVASVLAQMRQEAEGHEAAAAKIRDAMRRFSA